MTVKSIDLGGITRHTASEMSADGEMYDVVNLRKKYGRYMSVRENKAVFTAGDGVAGGEEDYQLLYIHENSGYEHWISYCGGALYLEMEKVGGELVAVGEKIADIDLPREVKSIGNILILVTSSDVLYFLYTGGHYTQIQDIRTPLDIQFTTEPVGKDVYYPHLYRYDNIAKVENDDTPVDGKILQALSDMRSEGFVGCQCLLRYAYRLYDGSYICQSQPILLVGSEGMQSLYLDRYEYYGDYDGHSAGDNDWYYGTYAYKIKMDVAKNDVLYSNREVIESVDIFMAEVSPYDYTDRYHLGEPFIFTDEPDKKRGLSKYYPFAHEDRVQKIAETADFRLVDSIKTSSLNADVSRELDLKGKLDNLLQQDRLPDDEFSHNTVTANSAFTYNSRLHLGDIATKLFSGFTPKDFNIGQSRFNAVDIPLPSPAVADSNTVALSYIETYIKTDLGDAVVVSRAEGFRLRGINPYLSYPDPRAYKMVVVCLCGERDYVRFEFELKPNEFLNSACYINPTLDPIWKTFAEPGGPVAYPEERNAVERATNKLKVSALDSPFVFPAEQTYTVGNGQIIGMASATAALSQGQFGQFPLYVFTTEGIWALETGTGEVVYASQSPVSRDVCSSPSSITPLDSAVAFASGKGLMLLAGSRTSCLSEALDGKPAVMYLPGAWTEALGLHGIDCSAAGTFLHYLGSARAGFSYSEKEIYITSGEYDYYYVYGVDTGLWSRRCGRITTLINNYPGFYAVDSRSRVLDMTSEDGTYRPAAWVTRPLKLSGQTYKRLSRSILRSLVTGEIDCFIFGSSDGVAFQLVNRVSGSVAGKRDIVFGRVVKSYKYFVYAFVSGRGSEVEINGLDISFDDIYNTILR